jgi:hypothetical protein
MHVCLPTELRKCDDLVYDPLLNELITFPATLLETKDIRKEETSCTFFSTLLVKYFS